MTLVHPSPLIHWWLQKHKSNNCSGLPFQTHWAWFQPPSRSLRPVLRKHLPREDGGRWTKKRKSLMDVNGCVMVCAMHIPTYIYISLCISLHTPTTNWHFVAPCSIFFLIVACGKYMMRRYTKERDTVAYLWDDVGKHPPPLNALYCHIKSYNDI